MIYIDRTSNQGAFLHSKVLYKVHLNVFSIRNRQKKFPGQNMMAQ